MSSRWYLWSLVPGLHWIAWIQAGALTRHAWYYWLGCLYASPLLLLATGWPPLRLMFFSWALSLIHLLVQRSEINRRIAEAATETTASADETLMQTLAEAAMFRRGRLSVTQGVMVTGRSFTDVKQALDRMVESGYVFMRNNPDTGVIEYVFKELL
jgi:hypothetical protein